MFLKRNVFKITILNNTELKVIIIILSKKNQQNKYPMILENFQSNKEKILTQKC